MREIKFRGKVKYNGNYLMSMDWVYGSLVIKSYGTFIYVIEEDNLGNIIREFDVEVIPETVGQYIDLKDRNDKEIYEGDILLVGYGSAKLKEFVSFHCGAFKKSYNESSGEIDRLPFTSLSSKNNEVIGNIHDNPDLLK